MVLLPYGVPLQDLEIETTPEEAKARLGVTGFCLGMVGRLEEQKGQEYLVAALPELVREIPHLTVLLVGDGRREEALRRQVQELDLEGVVHFLGTRRDLPLIYRALDLYVHPSRWEGLSLAILKAMAAGLPVIASRVSGTVEVIEDGVSGVLIPPEDPAALAAAVSRLYRQPETRQLMSQAARQAVQEHHSQETMLRRLESLYLELAEKGRRS
jgi:glycosyltransferase involved in cell wall biosynthesis